MFDLTNRHRLLRSGITVSLLIPLAGCAVLGSAMSPYSETFSCKNDDHGQCIHPERAYEDAAAGRTSRSDPAVTRDKALLKGKRRTRPLSCCCQYQLMLHGSRNTFISSLAFGFIFCRNESSSPTACCRPMQSMVRTERRTLSVVCGPQWWLYSPARSASSAVNE